MKALFGLWSGFKVSQINRLLRPFNVRLVLKKSKDWGAPVSLTAHHIKEPEKVAVLDLPDFRRTPKELASDPAAPAVDPLRSGEIAP